MSISICALRSFTILLASTLALSSAMARPFDLVVYNEREDGALWSIGKDADSGVPTVRVALCPKDTWIDRASQCGTPVDLMPISQFHAFARGEVQKWATEKPGIPLTPLTANDLKALASAPDAAKLVAERDKLRAELVSVNNMLDHLPNSPDYQKAKTELEKRVQELDAVLSPLSNVENTIRDLSDGILLLISKNNAKDGKINFFARSQMQGTFLHEVMKAIGSGSGVIQRTNLQQVKPGKRCYIKPLVDGWAYQLYCDGKFSGNFSDRVPAEMSALLKIVRDYASSGNW
jgi:hypothetical protein